MDGLVDPPGSPCLHPHPGRPQLLSLHQRGSRAICQRFPGLIQVPPTSTIQLFPSSQNLPWHPYPGASAEGSQPDFPGEKSCDVAC